MNLSSHQKTICEQVINAFETGSAQGDYSSIVIYADGPHGIKQITYGRAQTTEYGNLEELVEMYTKSNGIYSQQLKPYLPKIGVIPLMNDSVFKQLLRDAGRKDPIMQQTQVAFFDKRYFLPAMAWADAHGFKLPLSALVIYDSFIHSGGILPFLTKRFPEAKPVNGGNEQEWIKQYVDTRRDWLATHVKSILQKTVYRMDCFKHEIARNNWSLSLLPINANGVLVGA